MGELAKGIAICAAIACLSAACAQEMIPDLTKVRGIEHYDGPESGKVLLRKNGFVVVPRFHRRIFSPYATKALPHFVTADSVHRTFHVLFEEALKEMEGAFSSRVLTISEAMLGHFVSLRKGGEVSAGDADAARLAEDFFAVAVVLLDQSPKGHVSQAERVRREADLILSATGVAESPIFGYPVDYTQFKPRGFYTDSPKLERYFRAMSWFGNAAFRLKSDLETRAAVLIAREYLGNRDLRLRWDRIDTTYSYFIDQCDDLTPRDYGLLLHGMEAEGTGSDLPGRFKERAWKLRDPKINSMVLTPDQMPNWVSHSKGMRFFGKRYVPDSEAFMELTDPKVPGRGFPTGLDVMAANGSARALELAAAAPGAAVPGYAEGMARARNIFEDQRRAPTPSHYAEFFRVAGTLASPAAEQAPAFAKTVAYADKNLLTALASWASTRHAWMLHAEQSVIYMGMYEHDPIPGYVEPNPAFFNAMSRLVRKTERAFFEARMLGGKRFAGFSKLLSRLSTMVDKELAGKPFTKTETKLLDDYAYKIAELQGFSTNAIIDRDYPWMALIADVHTEMATRKCLEVGTGGAMPIYVVVEHKGIPHLLIGGVYSYCEFRQPIRNRLTDEDWREMWDQGRAVPLPGWSASFVAPFGAAALIERIRNGEEVDEIFSLGDAQVFDYLMKAAQLGGELADKPNIKWALEALTKRFGRKMVPLLLDLLRRGPMDDREKLVGKGRSQYSLSVPGPAKAASSALRKVMSEREMPALTEIAVNGEPERAMSAIGARLRGGKSEESFLADIIKGRRGYDVRWFCITGLGLRGSRDVTPVLLEAWHSGDSQVKVLVLDALVDVWTPGEKQKPLGSIGLSERPPRFPTLAGAADLKKWEEQVRQLVQGAMSHEDPKVKAVARRAAQRLGGVKGPAAE